ncbi:MAG TPA: AAA family ATPase [Rhodospirillaceae bacterium]|nr:AAA family ATPase [Rhodospirillaceae bacterium]
MQDPVSPLIQTKLAPPRTNAKLVRRRRLLSVLDNGRDRSLTLMVGPAGCGKTLLATTWRRDLIAGGCDVVWFAADREDDAVLLSRYLIEALNTLGMAMPRELSNAISLENEALIDRFISSLVNTLLKHPRDVYIFIDDFHLLESPVIVAMFGKILDLAPDNLKIVLMARSLPGLNVADLWVRGEVTAINFADLRFDLEESQEFLSRQDLPPMSSQEMRNILALTDGWAAGLQVVAYTLRRSRHCGNLDKVILPTQSNLLIDYLEECLVQDLDEEELSLLVRTAACRRFNAQLCEVITGNHRARELFRKLSDDGLFLLPIESDDAEPWYRFHRLFSKFLLRRLVALPEEDLRDLNRKASDWFAAQGHCVEAVHHAQYADDADRRVELVEGYARGMIENGEFLLVLKWVTSLPKAQVEKRLELMLCACWADMAAGRFEDFVATMKAIESHADAAGASVRLEIALLKAWHYIRTDDSAAILELMTPEVLALPRDKVFLADVVHNVQAWANIHAGQFTAARDLLIGGDGYPGCESSLNAGSCAGRAWFAMSFLKEGDLRQAKAALLKAMSAARGLAVHGLELLGLSSGLLAGALYGLDEIDAARELIRDYVDLVEMIAAADDLIAIFLAKARLAAADGDIAGALETLDQLEKSGARLGLDRPVAWSLAERVTIEVRRHNLPAAREAMRRLRNLAARHPGRWRSARGEIPLAAKLAEVELALGTGDNHQVLDLVAPIQKNCEELGRLGELIRLRLCEASALFALGQAEAARTAFKPALSLAAGLGQIRVFLDHGRDIRPLLALLADSGALTVKERELADYLLLRSETETTAGEAPPVKRQPSPATVLSAREREIMEMISGAYSNKSVARALNCSSNTVKWHLKNIFGKLGAVSREDAVIKARRLNLVGNKDDAAG